jgi:ABC-type antimicrobial peptide transport system permease subunit
MTSTLPLIAAGIFLLAGLYQTVGGARIKHIWVFPAVLSLVFLAFSLCAVIIEGPLGFWTEHTRNLWGNQIWFDLLLGVGIAWFFIAPQAKSVGMNTILWFFLILSTGGIGLTAMTARLLYLQEKTTPRE